MILCDEPILLAGLFKILEELLRHWKRTSFNPVDHKTVIVLKADSDA